MLIFIRSYAIVINNIYYFYINMGVFNGNKCCFYGCDIVISDIFSV